MGTDKLYYEDLKDAKLALLLSNRDLKCLIKKTTKENLAQSF